MQTFDIIIIGAGINGCSLAYTLKQKGLEVLVLEQEGIASGGSGAAGAFINPKISKSGPLKDVIEKAYLFSLDFYRDNFTDYTTFAPLLHIAKYEDENEKVEYFKEHTSLDIGEAPDELLSALLPYTRSFSNVYIKENAIVEARQVCEAMLKGIKLEKLKVHSAEYMDGLWSIESYKAKKLLVCTGAYEEIFKEPYIQLRRIYGQRCEVQSSTSMPATIHHEVSVSATKKNGRIAIGASHYLQKEQMPSKEEGESMLVTLAEKSVKLDDLKILGSFTGMRSGSNDYLPILGPVVKANESLLKYPMLLKGAKDTQLEYYPDLFMINGVGGYGFVLAPYLSHLMAEHLTENKDLPEFLLTERFFYRWVKKKAIV